jgi:hypothetical protein
MKTHRFDAISFLSGLVAVAIGMLYLVPKDAGDLFDAFGDLGRFFWPAFFLALGVAVLAPLAARMRSGGGEERAEDERGLDDRLPEDPVERAQGDE